MNQIFFFEAIDLCVVFCSFTKYVMEPDIVSVLYLFLDLDLGHFGSKRSPQPSRFGTHERSCSGFFHTSKFLVINTRYFWASFCLCWIRICHPKCGSGLISNRLLHTVIAFSVYCLLYLHFLSRSYRLNCSSVRYEYIHFSPCSVG